jgi:hypothetical protein
MSEANGTAPPAEPAAEAPCPDGDCISVTGGEKMMGLVAVLIACGVAAIAVDLLTGGRAWDAFKTAAPVAEG